MCHQMRDRARSLRMSEDAGVSLETANTTGATLGLSGAATVDNHCLNFVHGTTYTGVFVQGFSVV